MEKVWFEEMFDWLMKFDALQFGAKKNSDGKSKHIWLQLKNPKKKLIDWRKLLFFMKKSLVIILTFEDRSLLNS